MSRCLMWPCLYAHVSVAISLCVCFIMCLCQHNIQMQHEARMYCSWFVGPLDGRQEYHQGERL